MLKTYQYPHFEYAKPPELAAKVRKRYPVVIVGAGPVGLAAALDCRLQGIPVVLLDDDSTVSVGSRGLCYAKRALEILDRLGVGERCARRGWAGTSAARSFAKSRSTSSTCCPSRITSGRE